MLSEEDHRKVQEAIQILSSRSQTAEHERANIGASSSSSRLEDCSSGDSQPSTSRQETASSSRPTRPSSGGKFDITI